MSIGLSGGTAQSGKALNAFERITGLRLPKDFRTFLLAQDGARPDGNSFDVGDSNSCAVNRFIPLAEIAEQCSMIENLPATRLPIAWAEGGNYVCLETSATGGIYFWDHELPDEEHRLADSFDEFLNQLQPASVADVEIDPATVKRVWIDPDFLKSLKKD